MSTSSEKEPDYDEEEHQLAELLKRKLELEVLEQMLRDSIEHRRMESPTDGNSTTSEEPPTPQATTENVVCHVTEPLSPSRATPTGQSTSKAIKPENSLTIETDQNAGPSSTAESEQLIAAIRSLPPPRLKLTKPSRITPEEIRAENRLRNRIPTRQHAQEISATTKKVLRTTDDPKAVLAPSVIVRPVLTKMPTFDETLKELGVPEAAKTGAQKPLYFADCRIISESMFKDIVTKRAKGLLQSFQSTKVDRGTQTFVTNVGKQHVAGCVNCRSREHHFKNCALPYRPGFCQICGADGFDTDDCVYPHGIEHEYALQRCAGCAGDLSLYCPECPDCNIRYGDIVDWLRLNYATWPTALIPKDHRYLVNQGEEVLKRKVKARFNDSEDAANRVRAFLIRENALASASSIANPATKNAMALSEEKRQHAVQILSSSKARTTLSQIMEGRPELQTGEEVKIVIPTKYKKT